MSSDRLRYGVIGIRGMGRFHLRFARENPRVELVAVVDVDEDAVRRQAAALGVRGFTDHRALLDARLVDAVSIATPHRDLAPIARDCLAADLHILVEKPFATRTADARALIALAEQRRRHIGVAFQYRTYATARRLQAIIQSGVLGTVQQAAWRWAAFRPQAYYRDRAWRAAWNGSGGGVLMNQVSHDLDLLCWLFGPAVGASACIANQLHEGELEDAVTALIEFPHGVQVAFQATINQPRAAHGKVISGDRGLVTVCTDADQREHIQLGIFEPATRTAVGELPGGHDQPRIRWQGGTANRIKRRLRRLPGMDRLVSWRQRLSPPAPSGHQAIVDGFVRAALGDGEPVVSGRDALPTVELINALIMASVQKRWVDLPLDEQAYDRLFDSLSSGDAAVPRWR